MRSKPDPNPNPNPAPTLILTRIPTLTLRQTLRPGDYTLANAFGHQSDSNLRSVGGAIFAKSGTRE